MADNGFKNNAGKIEWYQDGVLVFTLYDSGTNGFYMITASGRFYIKKISDDSIVLTLWEDG